MRISLKFVILACVLRDHFGRQGQVAPPHCQLEGQCTLYLVSTDNQGGRGLCAAAEMELEFQLVLWSPPAPWWRSQLPPSPLIVQTDPGKWSREAWVPAGMKVQALANELPWHSQGAESTLDGFTQILWP